MKKNLIAGIIVSLAMTGIFGGVSFAADKKAEVKTEARIEAKAEKNAEIKEEIKADKKAEKKARHEAKKARILKCSPITIGTRLRRGRRMLYDILKKYDRLQRAICRFMTSRRLLAHSRIQVSSFSNVF